MCQWAFEFAIVAAAAAAENSQTKEICYYL